MGNDSNEADVGMNNSRHEEKIQSLHSGAALIGVTKTTNELYNAIIQTMTEVLGYPLSGLAIPDGEFMHFVRTLHESHGTDFSLPLDAPSISSRAYREKKTQIVNDVRKDPEYYAGPQGEKSGPQIQSSLVVPVIVEDKVRAILNLESTKLSAFSQMDVEILEVLGMHIASAVTRIDQISEIYESETRVQAIMNQAADAIVLMDIKDRIIFWNPAAERLFSYSIKEALGKTFYELLVPDHFKEKYVENRKKMLGMGLDNDIPSMECICQRKDGEDIVVEVSHSIVQYDGVPHVLRMVRDASDRKSYEKRLELLYEHASNLSQAKSIIDVYNVTREASSLVFGVNHGSIALIENNDLVFISERPKETWWRTPLDGKGISVRAVRTGETQFVPDTRLDPDYIEDNTESYEFEMRAELDVPIKIDDKVIGVYNVESSSADKFSEQDLRMVDIFVESIALTITRIRGDENRRLHEERLKMLYEYSLSLNEAESYIDIRNRTVEIINSVFGFNHGEIAMLRGEELVFQNNNPPDRWLRLPIDGPGITVRALNTGEIQLNNNAGADESYVVSSVGDGEISGSELDIPIKFGDKTVGVLNIESPQSDRFTENDVQLAEILAENIASTLQRVQAYEMTKRYEEKLESLHRSALILNEAKSIEELINSVIQIIKDILGTHWVGFAQPVETGMRIALASEYSMEEDLILPYDAKSIVMRAYRKQETVFVEDVQSDPDYVSVENEVLYVSELVVPVFASEEIFGLINIESTEIGEIADPEKRLVEILALYMGSAIERIRRQNALRESEERIRVLSQNAVDAIFAVNKEREFVIWNPAMEKMFGLTRDNFTDNTLEKLIVPEERWEEFYKEFGAIIEKRILTGNKVLESVAKRVDGTEIQVGYTASVIELDGEPHALFIMRDITEQKEQRDKINELLDQMQGLNTELERSNQDLENYTYVVSHDLKAPLRSIRSFGSFIIEDYADSLDDDGKEYLDRIINAATHMDDLIGDLLLLSRVGRKFTEEENIPLNELIDSIEEDIYATIEERNAKIIHEDLPSVKGQKTWVRQLFMNFITNGLKFNKSQTPTITIGVEEGEKFNTFSVQDNGIGIAKEYHDKIFQLFERLHTKTEYEGTGAGLTICKRIVENFGGKLWIESEEGKGSTFYFTYPREEVKNNNE